MTERILPPLLHPPEEPFRRRHRPRPGAYPYYRPCLRWEFGFVCPFCLSYREAWSEHFQLVEDALVPVAGDADADYTCRVYQVNTPRKVRARKERRDRLDLCLQVLGHRRRDLAQLQSLAQQERDRELTSVLLREAAELSKLISRAGDELLRYRAIPADADEACRCPEPRELSLPAGILVQTITLPEDGP